MRRPFVFLLLSVPLLGGYLGWTFYSRWRDVHAYMQRIEERQADQEAEKQRAFKEAYSGTLLTILTFYAAPSVIHPGETTKLCYGVANSKSVRIEPAVEYVWPSYSRCVKIAPMTDTVYKLIAEDDSGRTKTSSLTVTVR